MVELSLPPNSRIDTKAGKALPGAGRCQERAPLPHLPLRPGAGRRVRASTATISTWASCGPMVLDALLKIKNEVDTDAGAAPLVPRGHLRLVRHEHQRPEHACLHQGLRRTRRGRDPDLPAAAHAGGQGPGDRPDAISMRSTRPSNPGCRAARRPHPIASGCSPRRTRSGSTGRRPASSAPAARPPVRATGGTRIATWVRRRCWRPIAGSSTVVTRPRASGSMRSRTRSGCTAAIPS